MLFGPSDGLQLALRFLLCPQRGWSRRHQLGGHRSVPLVYNAIIVLIALHMSPTAPQPPLVIFCSCALYSFIYWFCCAHCPNKHSNASQEQWHSLSSKLPINIRCAFPTSHARKKTTRVCSRKQKLCYIDNNELLHNHRGFEPPQPFTKNFHLVCAHVSLLGGHTTTLTPKAQINPASLLPHTSESVKAISHKTAFQCIVPTINTSSKHRMP